MFLAGCVGGGGGSPTAADAPGSEGGTSEGGGSDAADGGDGGSGGGDDSARADDGLDLTDPEAALRDAGSFTATWRYAGTDERGQRGEIGFTYYADLDAGQTHIVYTTNGGAEAAGWEVYSTDAATYTRFGSGENAFYQAVEEERDVVGEAVSHAGVYRYGDAEGMHYAGTETYDGVAVKRYELTDADSMWWAAGAAMQGADAEVTVTDFEYVALIDEDGLARFESWSYAGETEDGEAVSAEWTYTVSAVGSTTVEEPDWLAEAAANATG